MATCSDMLLFSTMTSIYKCTPPLSPEGCSVFNNNVNNVSAIIYSRTSDTLYWYDKVAGELIKETESGETTVKTYIAADSFTIDDSTEIIYFTSADTIYYLNSDGGPFEFDTTTVDPTYIVWAAPERKMYWDDKPLAYDPQIQAMYSIDDNDGYILKAATFNDNYTVRLPRFTEASRMALNGEYLLWISSDNHEIYRCLRYKETCIPTIAMALPTYSVTDFRLSTHDGKDYLLVTYDGKVAEIDLSREEKLGRPISLDENFSYTRVIYEPGSQTYFWTDGTFVGSSPPIGGGLPVMFVKDGVDQIAVSVATNQLFYTVQGSTDIFSYNYSSEEHSVVFVADNPVIQMDLEADNQIICYVTERIVCREYSEGGSILIDFQLYTTVSDMAIDTDNHLVYCASRDFDSVGVYDYGQQTGISALTVTSGITGLAVIANTLYWYEPSQGIGTIKTDGTSNSIILAAWQRFTDIFVSDCYDCASDTCTYKGTCLDTISGHTCKCLYGYTSSDCDTETDECASNPCFHGGTCNDFFRFYTCTCADGYTGTHCESEIDECLSQPCVNGGTCWDFVSKYLCECKLGYTGTNCETNVDDCQDDPCQNEGSCLDGVNSFSCACVTGYTGFYCDGEIYECDSNPCKNGGTCTDGIAEFSCSCMDGYVGDFCEEDYDDCQMSQCQNGGTCVDQVNSYTCSCKPGYIGTLCETDVDECASSPCQNGATCLNEENQFVCNCAAGYTGITCEAEIYECRSNPCQNGATCTDGDNQYTCSCLAGYTGDQCETDIDECEGEPCQNNGTCLDEENKYTCLCLAGYVGTDCETEVNECSSDPCQNGATCIDYLDGYNCSCVPGFVGHHCTININECESIPCLNGGQCIDLINSYKCVCAEGYSGDHCEKGFGFLVYLGMGVIIMSVAGFLCRKSSVKGNRAKAATSHGRASSHFPLVHLPTGIQQPSGQLIYQQEHRF